MASESLADAYERLGYDKRAKRVKDCATQLTFDQCEDTTHPKRLKRANFCRVRLCPTCSWRRSLVVARQVSLVAHRVNMDKPSLQYLMLTLTMKNVNGEELSDAITKLIKSYAKLVRVKRFGIVKGWFRALEVTYNAKKNDYHPHLHVLLAVPPSYFSTGYIKQTEWVTMWQTALGVEYTPIVDVRRVKSKKRSEQQEALPNDAIREVAKYTTKPDIFEHVTHEPTLDGIVEVLDRALHNRRLIAFGGVFRDAYKDLEQEKKVSDAETSDLVHVDDDEIRQCTCSVCGSTLQEHLYQWFVGSNYIG